MENISSNDFDSLEILLKNRSFEELDWHEKQWVLTIIIETEYYSMSEIYTTLKKESETRFEVEPFVETKNKLDSSFNIISKPNVFLSLYHLKIPVYQSIGIALVCFTIGLFSTIYKMKPIVIHDTVQVIKYISKPSYANTLKPLRNFNNVLNKNHVKAIHKKTVAIENGADKIVNEETITEKSLQQGIAMQNINRVVNEKNGSSIEGDTILQKMLVTVY